MALVATVDAGGRIAIPDELRHELGLHTGSVLEFERTSVGLHLRPLAAPPAEPQEHTGLNEDHPSLFGILRNPNGPQFPSDEALEKAIDAAWQEAVAEKWLDKEHS